MLTLSNKTLKFLIDYESFLLFIFKPILMFSFHLCITLHSVHNNECVAWSVMWYV